MKSVSAMTFLKVKCNCPECGKSQDISDNKGVKEAMKLSLDALNCNLTINCEHCKKDFLLENIVY